MSLLMDALKRAETNKQITARKPAGREDAAGGSAIPDLDPLPPPKPQVEVLPDLAMHIAAVDADLASAAPPPSGPASPAATAPGAARSGPDNGPERARNAFAAKQAAAPASRQPLWLAVGALAVGGLAIAGYFWYQVSALNGNALRPVAQRPLQASTRGAARGDAPLAAVPLDPTTVFVPKPASTASARPEPEENAPAPRPSPETAAPPAAAPADTAGRPAAPIRVVRSAPRPDANLVEGHARLERGEFAEATRHFKLALRDDPNNTDALLALAAIARHQGQSAAADRLTQRALVADPSDPAVQAAALNSAAADADPQQTESRLKTLLSEQPASAELNFALGNLYARQGRWPAAQQAYFNAVAGENDNPDYLFNLAISLDHLRQDRLAARYYRQALDAASRRPATFAIAQAQGRLAELQRRPEP